MDNKLNLVYTSIVIFVTIGVLVGVGVYVLQTMGNSFKAPMGVVNQSITIASRTGTTTYDELLTVSNIGNTTVNCAYFNGPSACANYTLATGVFYLVSNFSDGAYKVTYTYTGDTQATTSINDSVVAIGSLVSWFAIIIVVIAASIILYYVTKSFTGR